MEELKEQRGLRKGAWSQGHTVPLMTQTRGCGKRAVRGLRLEGTAEAGPGLADPEPVWPVLSQAKHARGIRGQVELWPPGRSKCFIDKVDFPSGSQHTESEFKFNLPLWDSGKLGLLLPQNQREDSTPVSSAALGAQRLLSDHCRGQGPAGAESIVHIPER